MEPSHTARIARRRRRAGRERRYASIRRLFPNLLTTIALCSGMASLDFSIRGEWRMAILAIAAAAVFDMLDGLAARLLRASSRFGEVMDSLSDFLSFGVAPAALLHLWLLRGSDVFGLAAAMTYALCAALRLARYTAEAGSKPLPAPGQKAAPSRYFTGMPSPAAAGAVLAPAMIELSPVVSWSPPPWAVALLTLAVALLMISRIPMYSIKAVRVPRGAIVWILAPIALVVAAARKDIFLVGAVLGIGYLCTLPVSVWTARKGKAGEGVKAVGGVGDGGNGV